MVYNCLSAFVYIPGLTVCCHTSVVPKAPYLGAVRQKLPFGYHADSLLCICQNVYILTIDTLNRGSGTVWPINLV